MVNYNGNVNDIMIMIKHIMLDKNVKQKDICSATGQSKGTVSNLFPSLNIILELCKACD